LPFIHLVMSLSVIEISMLVYSDIGIPMLVYSDIGIFNIYAGCHVPKCYRDINAGI